MFDQELLHLFFLFRILYGISDNYISLPGPAVGYSDYDVFFKKIIEFHRYGVNSNSKTFL